jgi:2',5'-phosphodiesterase
MSQIITEFCFISDKDEEVKDVSLSHTLLLASAYGKPEFTNFTEGFIGCLDYIFYQHNQLDVAQVSSKKP